MCEDGMGKYTRAEIDHIAVEIGGGYDAEARQQWTAEESMFYVNLFTAWQRADWVNKSRLEPAMIKIIEECKFEKYLTYRYGRDMGRRMVEEDDGDGRKREEVA